MISNKLAAALSFTILIISSSLLLANSPSSPELSPIVVDGSLPFKLKISKADFQLPKGWHSGAFATYKGLWLLICGRTNGMHGFESNDHNFPPQDQNVTVFVIDPHRKKTYWRSLVEGHSGLTQAEVDLLSVTSPQFYQEGKTLYITGGYGIDTALDTFNTKPVLTAIDIPKLIAWVHHCDKKLKAKACVRQITNSIFQVTGGAMARIENHSTLLVFGQNFQGYYVPESSGDYTEVVRRFDIIDDGKHLDVKVRNSKPQEPDSNYHRRDLNVVPSIKLVNGVPTPYLIAYSGVFTSNDGPWTVPVTISGSGHPAMESPDSPYLFNQGMNNYASAFAGLFSKKHKDMFTIIFGGISLQSYQNGSFQIDPELPFINQVTAIRCNSKGHFTQYLLPVKYPTILSTQSNPGNELLFGAGAEFIPACNVPLYGNGIIKFDDLENKALLGYIVGGIQSSVPNTTTIHDSGASPYIFEVFLKKY